MRRMRSPLNELDDDKELMDALRDDIPPLPGSSASSPSSPFTLEAMAALLDKKLDEKLAPATRMVDEVKEDVERLDGHVENVSNEMMQLS